MKMLPDNYFDLIITDPPYGVNIMNNALGRDKVEVGGGSYFNSYDWDKSIPSEEYFNEMRRVSKNQVIFGGHYMTKYLPPSNCWVVWDKNNGNTVFGDCELIWTSFTSPIKIIRHRWDGFNKEYCDWTIKKKHPTQKPERVGRILLDMFAKEGDKIFDPFAGSGTFLVACKQKGYTFTGCELVDEYFEVINDRLCQSTFEEWI